MTGIELGVSVKYICEPRATAEGADSRSLCCIEREHNQASVEFLLNLEWYDAAVGHEDSLGRGREEGGVAARLMTILLAAYSVQT